MQRIARLTPLRDVLDQIVSHVEPVPPRTIGIADALGCTLAEDVSRGPLPTTSIALRDGWAVQSDLTTDAGSYAAAPLPNAARVDTGDALPVGADAVAAFEAIATRNGAAEALAAVTPGEGVLPVGADAGPDRALLRQGRRMGAVDLATLFAAGVMDVSVREPRIRLVSARARDAVLDAACIFLADAITPAGGAVAGAATAVPDLSSALRDPDSAAVIVVGGTGSGRNDSSVHTLAEVGRVAVHGIALSPGETAAFGFVDTRPVLLVPGRIDAAVAVWLTIGRHLLARLLGSREEPPPAVATLARKVASPLGMAEIVPVRYVEERVEPLAAGYWPLQVMAQADGWILVPAESEGYPAGAAVVVRPWP